jgi:hypothetical protein
MDNQVNAWKKNLTFKQHEIDVNILEKPSDLIAIWIIDSITIRFSPRAFPHQPPQ